MGYGLKRSTNGSCERVKCSRRTNGLKSQGMCELAIRGRCDRIHRRFRPRPPDTIEGFGKFASMLIVVSIVSMECCSRSQLPVPTKMWHLAVQNQLRQTLLLFLILRSRRHWSSITESLQWTCANVESLSSFVRSSRRLSMKVCCRIAHTLIRAITVRIFNAYRVLYSNCNMYGTEYLLKLNILRYFRSIAAFCEDAS